MLRVKHIFNVKIVGIRAPKARKVVVIHMQETNVIVAPITITTRLITY